MKNESSGLIRARIGMALLAGLLILGAASVWAVLRIHRGQFEASFEDRVKLLTRSSAHLLSLGLDGDPARLNRALDRFCAEERIARIAVFDPAGHQIFALTRESVRLDPTLLAFHPGVTLQRSEGVVCATAPVLRDGRDAASVTVAVTEETYVASVHQDESTLLLLLAMGVFFGGLLAAYRMQRPLLGAVGESLTFVPAFQQLASRDLTASLPERRRTLVAPVTESFNRMVHELRETVVRVQGYAQMVAQSATALSRNISELRETSGQIRHAVSEMSQGIQTQATRTQEVSGRLEELNTLAGRLADNAQDVSKVAGDARRAASEGGDAVGRVSRQMEGLIATSDEAAGQAAQLSEVGGQVGELLRLITDIADQAQLLSLNAAIEAARAGEHGQSFTVVAQEMRRLSEATGPAVKSATQLSAGINARLRDMERAMKASSTQVREGRQAADAAAKTLEQVLAVAEQLDRMAGEISRHSQDQKAAVGQVLRHVEDFSALAEETSAGTEQVTASVQEQTATIEEVNGAAQRMSRLAEDLRNLMGQFRL